MIDKLNELCMWLSHQKGMMSQDYAKELAKIIVQLRQQADRIAELEKDLALKTRDRDVFRDFTLAYEKRIEELEKLEQDFIRVIKQTNPNKPQAKPLSDEEILEEYRQCYGDDGTLTDCYFARAIEAKVRGEK